MPARPRIAARPVRHRRWLTACGAALSLALVPLAPVSSLADSTASTTTADARPFVSGDHTVAYYDRADTITETFDVVTEIDGDENGKPDRIRVLLYRPDAGGDKVPLIVQASPYYAGSTPSSWLTDYYVPRGYAVALVSMPGTENSTGCDDVGGNREVLGTKAVVDWANGRAKAYDLDGEPITAAWSTGKVGMIGGSWNGTIANAVASTGVQGLETIVPIASISSWYDYTRGQGIPFYNDYVAYLQEFVSNFSSPFCHDLTDILDQKSDDATGSYSKWWDPRNYRIDASKITASVYVVHGLTDENVKTIHFGKWWDQLEKYDVERKLFLHQGAHLDPVQFGAAWTTRLQEWFDHYLQGIDNGVEDGPQVTIQNQTGGFRDEAVWPPAGTEPHKMVLSKPLGRAAGALTVEADDASQDGTGTDAVAKVVKFHQTAEYSNDSVVANPTTPRSDRAVFLSDKLAAEVRESGTAHMKMRVKVDQPTAGFQARVVQYNQGGTAYIVSHTIADLGHYKSLRHKEELVPGKWYTLRFFINTDERTFNKGDRIGLVLTAEHDNPASPYTPVTAWVKTAKSALTMPLSGDIASLDSVGTDEPVVTTAVTPAEPTHDVFESIREFMSLQ